MTGGVLPVGKINNMKRKNNQRNTCVIEWHKRCFGITAEQEPNK